MKTTRGLVPAVLVLSALFLTTGCLNLPGYSGPDGSTDAGTSAVCAENSDCTDGLICNENWGICVVADCSGQDDFTPCEAITDPDRSYDICVSGVCVSPGCGDATCNTPGPHFPLPDTNQRLCFDEAAAMTCTSFPCNTDGSPEFCGQDAQYGWDTNHDEEERFARDLSTPGEPVVTDNVTGLVWQGCAAGLGGDNCNSGEDELINWESAVAYCDALEWAGQFDWRLPDKHELLTVIDFGAFSWPAVDAQAFPFTPENPTWTSTTRASNEANAWTVSFLYGTVNLPLKSDSHYVRCVRGTPTPQPDDRFERDLLVATQPIVVDKSTGLSWQGCLRGQSGNDCSTGYSICDSWTSALSYCEGLAWGADGAADWRLPNVIELESITDSRLSVPAIDADVFPMTDENGFWSSSSGTFDVYYSWAIFFADGDINGGGKDLVGATRCVRGGL